MFHRPAAASVTMYWDNRGENSWRFRMRGQAKLLTFGLCSWLCHDVLSLHLSLYLSSLFSLLSSLIQTMTAPYWLYMLRYSFISLPWRSCSAYMQCATLYWVCIYVFLRRIQILCVHSVLLVYSPPFPLSLVSSPLILLRLVLISSLFFPLFSSLLRYSPILYESLLPVRSCPLLSSFLCPTFSQEGNSVPICCRSSLHAFYCPLHKTRQGQTS